MSIELAELARAAGVGDAWIDAAGFRHRVDDESLRRVLESIGLACRTTSQRSRSASRLADRRRIAPVLLTTWVGSPTRLPFAMPASATFLLQYEDGAVVEGRIFEGDGGHWLPPVLHSGYHQLDVAGSRIALAVAPLRACSLSELIPAGRRIWGLSVRKPAAGHALDYSSLAMLARSAAGYGADALAVGNLHPGDRSGSGRWLDPRRIDASSSLPRPTLSSADADLMQTLRDYYQQQLPRDELLLREFLRFDRDGASALKSSVLTQLSRDDGMPSEPGDAASSPITGTAEEAVGFQMFLQWLAERGRSSAQATARAAGMAIGLIADFELTAAVDDGGSRADGQLFLEGLRSTDPSRPPSAQIQLAYNPDALAARAFAPFIDLLRANMGGVGGLRIQRFDRWWRHWLQAVDASEGSGTYLEYPFEDLLRLLVLESARQRCLIIVDDADALPIRLRDAVDQAGLMRSASFLHMRAPPASEPDLIDDTDANMANEPPSFGVVSSTGGSDAGLLGWWRADDIKARLDAAEMGTLVATREMVLRERERHQLLAELGIERRRGGRKKPERDRRDPLRAAAAGALKDESRDQVYEAHVVDAVIERLGSLPVPVALVDIDDLLGAESSQSLATMDAPELSRLLDAARPRSRLNRLDDARRAPPIATQAAAERAKSA